MRSTPVPLNIDCIMPAAGLSSRMGVWKLMLPYSIEENHESTILEMSVRNALRFCSRVILIAGYRSDELIQKMRIYPNVIIVVNQNYQQGMFSSIKLGIEQVRSEYFFIAHGDMPCINEGIYQQLWQKRAAGSVFPGGEDYSGHPVLLNSALIQTVLKETECASMKSILKRFPRTYLNLSDDNIHFDIDTPEAYQRLCAKISK